MHVDLITVCYLSYVYVCVCVCVGLLATHISPLPPVVDDTLDSVLAGSDEEEESEAIVGKVLDEIGIEMTSKVSRSKGRWKAKGSNTAQSLRYRAQWYLSLQDRTLTER